MRYSEQNKKHGLKERFIMLEEWIMDHNKIVMPVVLIVCILITVLVAVNANHRKIKEKEAEQAAIPVSAEETVPAEEESDTPVYELEKNTHPEINNVIRTYYDAQAEGNIETISSLNAYLDDIDTIRVQELSKYIDSYPVLDVYTKPGIEDNTYVAYVYSETLFSDVEKALPGMQTYYIGQNESGDFFINDGTYNVDVWDYIKALTLQDDVVDLNNKVAVEYNEMLAEDEELNEYVAYLKEKINEDVGEILAQAELPAQESASETDASNDAETADASEGENTEAPLTVLKTVRATDVVNIRSSDSEEADKLDKAQIGQEFTLLEEKGNGWSKIKYNDREAYIKSDYLEEAAQETADTQVASSEGSDEDQEEEEAEASQEISTAENSTGKVTVIESVKVRKSASTEAESLGTAYTGEELELLMKQADGWTRVKYKGQSAYVKSDYVE
ncbi:MAG: SH3 domain-containing protein [Lachnospiraceae bacterium]|nr:SH3 domain-containing protein [Lachnospiraceae bacterium]MCI9096835.1 SH3 domain-containing protein [Lachnospiraceae bacterium]